MTELCGEPHPQNPGVLCDKPKDCWVYHANAREQLTWEGTPLPPSAAPKGSLKGRLAEMAQRAR